MVNPLGHWIRVPFCTRSHIPLRGLSGSWGIRLQIPFRVLSGFQVPPGLVFLANKITNKEEILNQGKTLKPPYRESFEVDQEPNIRIIGRILILDVGRN